jgi:hypothetical protein
MRLPTVDAISVFNWLQVGDGVDVYGNAERQRVATFGLEDVGWRAMRMRGRELSIL